MTHSRRRQQPERALQTALVQHLNLRARNGVLYFAVPNGGSRDVREAVNLRRAGVLPGVSDLLLFRPGVCSHCGSARLEGFALELKAPGGRPSEAQLNFMARFAAVGGHTCVAEGIDEALRSLMRGALSSGGVSDRARRHIAPRLRVRRP
jgi:hypothetical protein